jgi:hypothetical protein
MYKTIIVQRCVGQLKNTEISFDLEFVQRFVAHF